MLNAVNQTARKLSKGCMIVAERRKRTIRLTPHPHTTFTPIEHARPSAHLPLQTMNTRVNYVQLGDQGLVQAFQQGDRRAFEVLVRRHRAKLLGTILNVVKERTVAEDLYQEALMKIAQVIVSGRYNEEGKFLPWALRIARNAAIDSFRKDKRAPQMKRGDSLTGLEHVFRTEDNMERQMIRQETTQYVRKLIDRLPDKQKEVLIMRHYNELSFKEIARLTDVSINTALGRMRYALVNLRKLVQKGGER